MRHPWIHIVASLNEIMKREENERALRNGRGRNENNLNAYVIIIIRGRVNLIFFFVFCSCAHKISVMVENFFPFHILRPHS